MKWFRIAMVAILVVCAAPLLSVLIAGTIADHYGCTLHEGFVNPCVIDGVDYGETLYSMGVMGWFMLATLPIAAGTLLVWVVVEVVRAIKRRRK